MISSFRSFMTASRGYNALRTLASTPLSQNASTLVLAEHDSVNLKDSTLCAVRAAAQLGSDVSVLIAGQDVSGVVERAAKVAGVTQVFQADSPKLKDRLAEPVTDVLVALTKKGGFSHVVSGSTTFGKNILPRAAALLDCAMISDVQQIVDADTFVRPIYAGNALATVQVTADGPRILTVRTTAFPAAEREGGSATTAMCEGEVKDLTLQAEFVSNELSKSERPELGAARVVVSGGRGLKSGENFALLEELADKLGGAVGASRAAVDAGMVPNDLQVGQTGKVVAPELYVAVGISGAIQHLAGMKDSKTIVAINKDEEAPIFQVADYGLVADLFDAVPELTSKVDAA